MVFAYLKEHPGLRANALAEGLSLPKRTLGRHLGQLKKDGRIEFKGAPKSGGVLLQMTAFRDLMDGVVKIRGKLHRAEKLLVTPLA